MINDVVNTLKTGNISGWDDFLRCLPDNWREIAESSEMLKGQRKDKDPETLMHVLMLHLLCGCPLRKTTAVACLPPPRAVFPPPPPQCFPPLPPPRHAFKDLNLMDKTLRQRINH
jgi:hypothetical protein